MNSTTQMMKIASPKLSYLFRRAFGLLLFFIFGCYDSQITLIGDVVVVDNKNDSTVYISSGTYVSNSETSEKPKHKKANKTTIKKKKSFAKLVSNKKPRTSVYKYHYSPAPIRDILSSASTSRITSINNFDPHTMSKVIIVSWQTSYIFHFCISESFKEINGAKSKHFHYQSKIRPPPDFKII